MKHSAFPRDLGAARYLDLFIVGGVSAVLAIRFILRITGYPSLGGARFHIAHMLWGGLLMAAALLASLSFLGNRTRLWAALVGGIGFGTFIDEIGKFITRDNDYFYQPSIALIYITFVLIYLAFRDLQMRRGVSREEYLVNAVHDLEEAVINDLQPKERTRALRYLGAIAEKDDLTLGLAALIERGGLITLFVLQLAVNAATVALIVVRDLSAGIVAEVSGQRGRILGLLPVSAWLLLGATLIPSIFVVIAVIALRRSRMTALHFFHRAVLLSICFTEVFMFYRNQVAALLVLAFNLISWACINVVITGETRNRTRAGH
ncbi:MAG: hypothetical protein M3Z54_01400 [Gemmatimonadota bacterium]|nr:hypothetical protein [Gemmatimonadota bacterium]